MVRRQELPNENPGVYMRGILFVMLVAASLATPPAPARAQELADSANTSSADTSSANTSVIVASTAPALPDLTYTPPTRAAKLYNYVFDAFGPYPIVGAGFAAGINQAHNSPPEWKQGAEGYGKRFGSNFGIAGVSTTTRYALADALREDMLYYRCQCKGALPRLRHALISTLTARRGEDGHLVFSWPALFAPYVGSMTAVYTWYPGRYNGKDAFRMGNYALLAYAGGNVGMEFLYRGPHSLLSRMHLNNGRGARTPVSTP
ncbi:MAG: hypothetical protein ABSG34_05545 [Candidatus Sulfotelmatobacter sp.]